MKIRKYAKKNAIIPLATLKWMVAEKFIHDPLTREDCIGVLLIEKTWGGSKIVFPQVAEITPREWQDLFLNFKG